MKRPEQHIIETKSKKNFDKLIPDSWVARELGSDYGLDYLVEIFKSNSSTGQLFFVQLKGTDTEIINDIISYQLSVDNIDYWNTITIPVLLVFYSTKSGKFWGIWSNQLKQNFPLKKSKQKKVTIKLTSKNLLSPSYFFELENQFDNTLPSKINVSYDGNSDESKLLHECLKKWLVYFFNNNVDFENHQLPITCGIKYDIISEKSIQLEITTRGKTIVLQPAMFSGNENFLHLPDIEIDNVPPSLSEILLLFALLNCEKNISECLKIINATIVNYEGPYLPMESFLHLVRVAIKHEKENELNRLASILIQSKRINEFQFLNSSILFFNSNKSLNKLYQDNLLFAISKIEDTHFKGLFSYNIANSYRSSSNYYYSSLNYQNARRYEPKYKNKFYWWFEYAGVLFLSGHPKIAEDFYLKSYDLDKSQNIPLIYGLIGDCKFFQGKFSDSIVYYEKFKSSDGKLEGVSDEFILKLTVARNLVELKLDNMLIDPILSSKIMKEALDKNQENLFEKAIIANPLNAHAWFNYSLFFHSKGELESAFVGFITTACIQPGDSEAWKNALLLSFNTKYAILFQVIFSVAYVSIGNEFLNYCSRSILDLPDFSIQEKKTLIELFVEIAKTYNS